MITSFPMHLDAPTIPASSIVKIDLDGDQIYASPVSSDIESEPNPASPGDRWRRLALPVFGLIPNDSGKKGLLEALQDQAKHSDFFKRALDLYTRRAAEVQEALFSGGIYPKRDTHQVALFRVDGQYLHLHPDAQARRKVLRQKIDASSKPSLVPGQCRVEGCTSTMLVAKSQSGFSPEGSGLPAGVFWSANINTPEGTHYGCVQSSSMGLCPEHMAQHINGLASHSNWKGISKGLYFGGWSTDEDMDYESDIVDAISATKEEDLVEVVNHLSVLEAAHKAIRGKEGSTLASDRLHQSTHLMLLKHNKVRMGCLEYIHTTRSELLTNLQAFFTRFQYTPLRWLISASLGASGSYRPEISNMEWQRWVHRVFHGGKQTRTEVSRTVRVARLDILRGVSPGDFNMKQRLLLLKDAAHMDNPNYQTSPAYKLGMAVAEAIQSASFSRQKGMLPVVDRISHFPQTGLALLHSKLLKLNCTKNGTNFVREANFNRLLAESGNIAQQRVLSLEDQVSFILGYRTRDQEIRDERAKTKADKAENTNNAADAADEE